MVTRRPRERSSRPRRRGRESLAERGGDAPGHEHVLGGRLLHGVPSYPSGTGASEPDAPNEPPGVGQHVHQREHGGHPAGRASRCRRRWRRAGRGGADAQAAMLASAVGPATTTPLRDGGQAGDETGQHGLARRRCRRRRAPAARRRARRPGRPSRPAPCRLARSEATLRRRPSRPTRFVVATARPMSWPIRS